MKAKLKICFIISSTMLMLLACKDKTVEPDDNIEVEAEWEYLGLEGEYLNVLEIAPSKPSVIYLSSFTKLYKSTNSGTSWDSISSYHFNSIAIDPSNPEILYGGTGALLKSIDGGITWERKFEIEGADFNTPVYVVKMDPNNSTILFASGTSEFGGMIVKSTNGGELWTKKDDIGAQNIEIAPSKSNIIYASTSGTLYKSTDIGESWNYIGNPGGYAIWIDPLNPEKIIIGYTSYYGTILNSENGGESWDNYSEGILENSTVRRITYNKNNGDLFALAVYNDDHGSIYKRGKSDTEWAKIGIDDSLAIGNINYDLKVDNAGKYLFFCSSCGVYRLKLS